MDKFIVPPDAPSTWRKRSPACSSAARTPAWYATRIPPPARTSERCGPARPSPSRGANGDGSMAITPVDRAVQRGGRVPGVHRRCPAGRPALRQPARTRRRWQPGLGQPQVDDALQAFRLGRGWFVEGQEPPLVVVVEDARGRWEKGREEGPGGDAEFLQRCRAGAVADQELRRAWHAGADAAVEVDRRLHEHAPELAEVRGRRPDGKPGPPRFADRDPHGEMSVQVILAGNRAVVDPEVQIGLVLGHSPDAFTSLDRYLGAHGQVVHVLAHVVVPRQEQREQWGRGPQAVGDADGDAELDVLADVG